MMKKKKSTERNGTERIWERRTGKSNTKRENKVAINHSTPVLLKGGK